MLTKEKCLEKYEECKLSKNGPTPACQEFLKFADIDKRTLARLFGSAAYSKLQELAGDMPNRLQLERTPLETIMRQYGNLVTELGVVPAYAEWDHRRLRPTETGLSKKPHKIKWSEMPTKFVEWVTINNISGFEEAINVNAASTQSTNNKRRNRDSDFERLIKDIREWTPARRRNSKAEYKIELRKHLESLKHELNEEFGESKFDLLVRKEYAIEIKKDPDLAEYDRLFGQLARHLQNQCKVIVLILEATRKDKFDNFATLVDRYLNLEKNSIEVIKR